MKLLLDTHALLWWLDDDPRLRADAREHIADRRHLVYVSAASIWEASIKEAKGLLRLSPDFDEKLAAEPLQPLSITHHHGAGSANSRRSTRTRSTACSSHSASSKA